MVNVFPAPVLRWVVSPPPDPAAVERLASALSAARTRSPPCWCSAARPTSRPRARFLRPALDGLSDPAALRRHGRGGGRHRATVRAGGTIMVHGDYDVDGQCATALLTRALRAAGADVVGFVPHRLRDGYDFGPAGLAAAQRLGVSLVITCDCGITAVDTVRAARAAGIGVVVTDHHLPGAELPPALAVVDPQRADDTSGARGALRHRHRVQAGAGAGARARAPAEPAVPPARPRGAGHRGRRGAARRREPHPGPARAPAARPRAGGPGSGR